jgi:hypothetical protein
MINGAYGSNSCLISELYKSPNHTVIKNEAFWKFKLVVHVIP